MEFWKNAGSGERKLFAAISLLFADSPGLVAFLFDPHRPQLKAPPEDMLGAARGLASGDFLRVRVALDLWSGSGSVCVHELIGADPDVYRSILRAMTELA